MAVWRCAVWCRASSWRSCSREDMDEHLRVFAIDGLRTLMLAQKEVRHTSSRQGARVEEQLADR